MTEPRLSRLLTALGHDPKTHTAWVQGDPSKGWGLQVCKDGEPVRFYAGSKLARLREDDEFLRRWEAAP